MLNNIHIITRRLEQRVISKESARQKVQANAGSTETGIAEAQQQKQILQQHLASLTIAGKTSLEDILENKARQGALQRRMADIDLMLADQQQLLQQLNQRMELLRSERNSLQRKADKITSQLQRRRQLQQRGRERQYEAETEEQLNWQM